MTEDVKRTLYTTIKLEYATPAWKPHYNCDVEKLERVQRSAAQYCTGDYQYTSSATSMLDTVQITNIYIHCHKYARYCTGDYRYTSVVTSMLDILQEITDINPVSQVCFRKYKCSPLKRGEKSHV